MIITTSQSGRQSDKCVERQIGQIKEVIYI